MSFKPKQFLPALILFIFFLSLYIYTAAPGVYDGDSGEIAAAVNQLGLAHPTGFPLYMLSGKLFTLLVPIKDIAYRLNIFSSILTVSALVFFYYTLKNLGNSQFSSITATFILGLGRNTIWSNAGTARVYALSFLFVAILFFIFSKWRKEPKTKYLHWYGFFWGLSLGTHALMLIMAIPFIYMLWQARHIIKRRIGILGKTILLTLIPAIQYLYLLFAYKRNTIVNWGDMSSWDGFIYYITQRQYATKIFANTFSDAGSLLIKIAGLLTSEFTIIFFGVALVGLVYIFKKSRSLFVVLFSMILANIVMMFNYGKSAELLILYRYVFLTDAILALAVAFGLEALIGLMKIFKSSQRSAFTIVVILIIVFQFRNSYAYNNRSNAYIFEDFARNTLISMELNSILFADEDPVINPIWYLQSLGERSDVVVLSAGLLNNDWYLEQQIKKHPDILDDTILAKKWDGNRISAIIDKNIKDKRIYTTFTSWDKYSQSYLDFIPTGTVYAAVGKDGRGVLELLQKNESLWSRYALRNIKPEKHGDFMANRLIYYYSLSLNNIGVVYARLNLLKQAVYFLQKSMDIIPSVSTKENLRQVETKIAQ